MTEAQLVAATGLLGFLLVLPPVVALLRSEGVRVALGNRENPATLPEWSHRASRAQRNLVDNLLPFLAIVLAAQMAGVSNEKTQFGIALFFWGRVAHALIYVAGIPYLRTLAFAVSLIGVIRVAGAVFGA